MPPPRPRKGAESTPGLRVTTPLNLPADPSLPAPAGARPSELSLTTDPGSFSRGPNSTPSERADYQRSLVPVPPASARPAGTPDRIKEKASSPLALKGATTPPTPPSGSASASAEAQGLRAELEEERRRSKALEAQLAAERKRVKELEDEIMLLRLGPSATAKPKLDDLAGACACT